MEGLKVSMLEAGVEVLVVRFQELVVLAMGLLEVGARYLMAFVMKEVALAVFFQLAAVVWASRLCSQPLTQVWNPVHQPV